MAYSDRTTASRTFIPGPQDLVKALRKYWRRQVKRNEIKSLLDKPDWVLKDMGVTRGDVIEALAFRGDPSLHLRALCARRRFWTRAADRF